MRNVKISTFFFPELQEDSFLYNSFSHPSNFDSEEEVRNNLLDNSEITYSTD